MNPPRALNFGDGTPQKPPTPMGGPLMPSMPQGAAPMPSPLQGSAPPQEVKIVPWDVFVACSTYAHKDGEVVKINFEPWPMETPDEAFLVIRFLLNCQWKPETTRVDWATIPEEVRRHFKPEPADPKADEPATQ